MKECPANVLPFCRNFWGDNNSGLPYRFIKTYQKKYKASGDNMEATDNTYIHAKTNRNTNTNIHIDTNIEI